MNKDTGKPKFRLNWVIGCMLVAIFINTLANVILTKKVYAGFDQINMTFKVLNDKINNVRDAK